MIRAALACLVLAMATPTHALTPTELATLVVPLPKVPATRTPSSDIRRLLRPEASILQARNRLDQDLERRTTELARARYLASVLDSDVAIQTRHFDSLTASLELARVGVRQRVAALTRVGHTSCAARTLGRATWADAALACSAASRLALADYGRVFVYVLELGRWRVVGADLKRREDNLARTRLTITYLEQELAWDHEERAALEAAVVKEPEFYATYAHEMEALDAETAARVETLIAEAPKDRPRLYLEETRGGLSSPIRNADLAGGFGTRQFLGMRSKWHGIHLVPLRPPREGERTDVRAIYWGYVAWTGWLTGLGKVVILDHSMGYASLYAHLASLDVKVGDKVGTGTTLGAMGATESFFGPRLYLELRKDGVALDPMPWFKK